MSKRFLSKVGEKVIAYAVERRMNSLTDWKKDVKLKSHFRFEQSDRLLVKPVLGDLQNSQFVDDLYKVCLGLLDLRGWYL